MSTTLKSPLLPLASLLLFWFAVFAAAVGAAPFVLARDTLLHPQLGWVAIVGLLITTVLNRVIPALRQQQSLVVLTDIVALSLFALLLCAATDDLDSRLLALFLLPLTAAALLLSRFGYLLTALLVLLAHVLLGVLTPQLQLGSSAFAMRLLGSLGPAFIATSAISLLMSQMQVAEQQIRNLSSSDALTGLLNLRAFENLLEQTHRLAEHNGRFYSLAVIDLDNLPQINELYGHDTGNQMLVAVADAVRRSIRGADTAARLGGNEIVVLLHEADVTAANVVAQRIRSSVYAGTISVANRLLRANVSIGVASFPKEFLAAKELLSQAIQRMQKDRNLRRAAERPVAPLA